MRAWRIPHIPEFHGFIVFLNRQPKSSVNVLLEEMITKFEEEPPLGMKSTGDGKDPNELLAFMSHINLKEGGFAMMTCSLSELCLYVHKLYPHI